MEFEKILWGGVRVCHAGCVFAILRKSGGTMNDGAKGDVKGGKFVGMELKL